jgi:hypothetical protein
VWEGEDRIHMEQEGDQRQVLLKRIMNVRVPKKAGKFLTSCMTISLSGSKTLHGTS